MFNTIFKKKKMYSKLIAYIDCNVTAGEIGNDGGRFKNSAELQSNTFQTVCQCEDCAFFVQMFLKDEEMF